MVDQPISLTANKLASTKSNDVSSICSESGFVLRQRLAQAFCSSQIVPPQFRSQILNPKNHKEITENPAGMANCFVAIDMAERLGLSPVMVMQNLYFIEGRAVWSAQFVIACINSCGRFSQLQFAIEDLGKKEVTFTEYRWDGSKKVPIQSRITISDKKCVAFAYLRDSNERVESSPVTIELAVKEGWYTKNGSKWQSMPEQMLRYRAASFFGRLYASDILMGIESQDELDDEKIEYVEVLPDGDVNTGQRKNRNPIAVNPTPAAPEPVTNKVQTVTSESQNEAADNSSMSYEQSGKKVNTKHNLNSENEKALNTNLPPKFTSTDTTTTTKDNLLI